MDHAASADGITDSSSGIQAAYTAAVAAGGGIVYMPTGTYRLSSAAISLVRNNTSTPVPIIFKGAGRDKTIIKLTTTSKSFTNFTKVADHDVFRDIYFEDFSIDADNIVASAHAIVGTYTNNLYHVNIQDISVRRVRVYNLTTDPTNASVMIGVYLVPAQNALAEATQNYVKNILCEDVVIEGGNGGIIIGGTCDVSGSTVNIFYDNIKLHRCKITMAATPTAVTPQDGIQVGSFAYGGSISIRDCYVANCPDTGVEINNAAYCVVKDTVTSDCANYGFLTKQFRTATGGQQYVFEGCRNEVISISGPGSASLPCYGLAVDNDTSTSGGQATGSVTVRDFEQYMAAQTHDVVVGQAIRIATVPVRQVTLQNIRFDSPGYAVADNVSTVPVPIWIAPTSALTIRVENVYVRVVGSRTNNLTSMRVLQVEPATASQVWIDGVTLEASITLSTATFTPSLVALGLSTSSFDGSVRRVKALTMTGATNAIGVNIGGTATLTISNRIVVADCELSGVTTGVSIGSGNEAKVWFDSPVTAPTLAGTWANFGAPYANAGYWKTSDGYLKLRGSIKNGAANGNIINPLPAGYRPTADAQVVVRAYDGTVYVLAGVYVTSAGVVQAIGNSIAANNQFWLDGVSIYLG